MSRDSRGRTLPPVTSMHGQIVEPVCIVCGTRRRDEWWWWCMEHSVWECDGCSYPGNGRPYDDGSHRFMCGRIEGIKIDRSGRAKVWASGAD